MAMSWKDLSPEQLTGQPSRLAFDVLGAWVDYHQYASLVYGPNFRVKPLKPTVRADAYRLGLIFCRGVVATQAADPKPNWNQYDYEFMVAANLILVAAEAKHVSEITELYHELSPCTNLDQKLKLLYFFVKQSHEAKGAAAQSALDFFVCASESIEFKPENREEESTHLAFYGLWLGYLEDSPGPVLTEAQRRLLTQKIDAFSGTKVDRFYKRHRKVR
jgi:hypothetical protein